MRNVRSISSARPTGIALREGNIDGDRSTLESGRRCVFLLKALSQPLAADSIASRLYLTEEGTGN